jgi:hypothetical protein
MEWVGTESVPYFLPMCEAIVSLKNATVLLQHLSLSHNLHQDSHPCEIIIHLVNFLTPVVL